MPVHGPFALLPAPLLQQQLSLLCALTRVGQQLGHVQPVRPLAGVVLGHWAARHACAQQQLVQRRQRRQLQQQQQQQRMLRGRRPPSQQVTHTHGPMPYLHIQQGSTPAAHTLVHRASEQPTPHSPTPHPAATSTQTHRLFPEPSPLLANTTSTHATHARPSTHKHALRVRVPVRRHSQSARRVARLHTVRGLKPVDTLRLGRVMLALSLRGGQFVSEGVKVERGGTNVGRRGGLRMKNGRGPAGDHAAPTAAAVAAAIAPCLSSDSQALSMLCCELRCLARAKRLPRAQQAEAAAVAEQLQLQVGQQHA